MYQRKTDGIMYFVSAFMVTFVIVFMAGTTYCRVNDDSDYLPSNEVKMVARIEGWDKNNNDFSINEKMVEINIDATGSTTDVKYSVEISNIPDGVKLYKDENFLYDLDNNFNGIINYKETMKKKIVFYIENNNDFLSEDKIDMINVKILFDKQQVILWEIKV